MTFYRYGISALALIAASAAPAAAQSDPKTSGPGLQPGETVENEGAASQPRASGNGAPAADPSLTPGETVDNEGAASQAGGAKAGANDGVLDTLVPDDAAPAAPPPPTGDPILDRLNALEAKVLALEARNRQLEQQAGLSEGRIEAVEVRAAKAAQPGVVPTYSDTAGAFTFKVRGVVDADVVGFNEREGGYDYNNGTAFRRARLGFEGDAFTDFKWRIEVDFAGNAVAIQDAYLQYVGIKPLVLTLGQHKAPFALESNNSDNYNVFLERGMFNVAAGNAVAERRVGASAAYVKDNFNATVGLFGENESVIRAGNTTVDTPDESWGGNARVNWQPVLDTGKVIHVGAAAAWRTALRSGDTGDAFRLSDRPNIRVDGGNIVDTGVVPNAKSLRYLGAEAAAVFGPLTLAAEYGHLRANRFGGLSDPSFDGFYAYATWFLTGESRPFRNGNFDRLKPLANFDRKGGWGAWELALRYDRADLSDTPVAARAGNDAQTVTAGINWYLNPNFKLQLNYIRFSGDNTPLDPVGGETEGDALAARVHFDW